MTKHSRAKELGGYSSLVVFANDSGIDENELKMLERLKREDCGECVWREIAAFSEKYNI